MATNYDNLKQELGSSQTTGDPNDQALVISRKVAKGAPKANITPPRLAAMLKSVGKAKRGNS